MPSIQDNRPTNEAPASLAGTRGSAPWAWTHSRDMEYWTPVPGKSREAGIAEGKRRGYRKFWIAQCRRMTAEEKEEYDGSWIVDPTTEEG